MGEANGELVGQEYIEKVYDIDEAIFICKLCRCIFYGSVEKDRHLKSRNHKSLYKEVRSLRQQCTYGYGYGTLPKLTTDDRYMLAKHAEISPSGQQLYEINCVVSHVEYALQSLADTFFELIKPTKQHTAQTEAPFNNNKRTKLDNNEVVCHDQMSWLVPFVARPRLSAPPPNIDDAGATLCVRELKSVMRVGPLAEGLLLEGERAVRLVVLCHSRPTVELLLRLTENLVYHLGRTLSVFTVEPLLAESAVRVSYGTVSVLVSITSTASRQPPDCYEQYQNLLPQEKCLEALAAMRRARWFQAKVAPAQSWVSIIRILRDICRRSPVWATLSTYMVELLVSSILRGVVQPHAAAAFQGWGLPPAAVPSAAQCEGQKATPALGAALRRVMEALAGGLLLDPGRGLRDPCETHIVDAFGNLTAQSREDITASAQLFIRLIAFRKMYKVLNMERWPSFFPSAGVRRLWISKRSNKRNVIELTQDTNVCGVGDEARGAELNQIIFDEDYDPKTGVISSLYEEILSLKREIAETNIDMVTVKSEIIVIDDETSPVKIEIMD